MSRKINLRFWIFVYTGDSEDILATAATTTVAFDVAQTLAATRPNCRIVVRDMQDNKPRVIWRSRPVDHPRSVLARAAADG